MVHTLSFTERHHYRDSIKQSGIVLELKLSNGRVSIGTFAHLDTGAPFCLFHPDFGRYLGLDIEKGHPETFTTLHGSSSTAYGHSLTIEVLGTRCDSVVFFYSDEMSTQRNFLGRTGWLDRIRLGLIHYDNELYLEPY